VPLRITSEFKKINSVQSNENNEGNCLLPFEVELELYALNDYTRNLLVVTLLSLVMYYGWTRSARDETWVERKFASYFTLSILSWLSLMIIIPFSILSFFHPNLVLEIGERILYDIMPATILLVVIIIIIQALNSKGYFQKRE